MAKKTLDWLALQIIAVFAERGLNAAYIEDTQKQVGRVSAAYPDI